MAEQEATIRDQAEMIGRQAAELAAARTQSATVDASGSTEGPAPTERGGAALPWWRRWLSMAYGG